MKSLRPPTPAQPFDIDHNADNEHKINTTTHFIGSFFAIAGGFWYKGGLLG